ncbi:MAG: L-seryl-tRNA(Sec) selenium transferase [Desulfobacterales bacterium]|nr:L-seryl-tRNA(Sec) selenium transferase [Desulfobacterales bacterium]
MHPSQEQQRLLTQIPGVDRLLDAAADRPFAAGVPQTILVRCIRALEEELRSAILSKDSSAAQKAPSVEALLEKLAPMVQKAAAPKLQRTINATGVVIHTNLGRSLLADAAIENLVRISSRYSNLEYDLEAGRRGSRYSAVEEILCEITGAESAMVVNNNAGAVLLALETLAAGRSAVVSRGELVEIGGAFRIPDVMAKSGAILKEVGTTNRTHLRDYEAAIDEETGLLLKVHKSNYSIVGFTAEVSLSELVSLGNRHGIPVMEDLGSGMFIDFSRYGLPKEPTVQEAVATGADVVTFSGDKLLGGPQAGILVGKKGCLDRIKKNPITRALRIDKMTLAALESTMRLYREERAAVVQIPTLRMILMPLDTVAGLAERLRTELDKIGDDRLQARLLDRFSRAGGGSLPLLQLPTRCVGVRISGMSAARLETAMRDYCPPIIGRIEEDLFLMDPRTLQEEEIEMIASAFQFVLEKAAS